MSAPLSHAALWIAATIFESLWEGALIAGIVWVGLRCLPRLGAATRYAIWLCALAAVVAVPLLTVGLSWPSHDARAGILGGLRRRAQGTTVTPVPAMTSPI